MHPKQLFLIAAVVMSAATWPAAGQVPDTAERLENRHGEGSPARETWRAQMDAIKPTGEGCFHARYPSTVLQQVSCKAAPPRSFASPHAPAARGASKAAGFSGYALGAPGLILEAAGSFPVVEGVTSVMSVPPGGNNGPNDYSLQLNTNKGSTPTCEGRPNCSAWQQFIYSTDVDTGTAKIFMEYWLYNYGECPAGWDGSGTCVKNSPAAQVPYIPVTELGKVQFRGYAQYRQLDGVRLVYGDDIYETAAADKEVQISKLWQQAEFNVYGNGGGSTAVFNSGSFIAVRVEARYPNYPSQAPACLANQITAEQNNLDVGACVATAYDASRPDAYPFIQFVESLNVPLQNTAITWPQWFQEVPSWDRFWPAGTGQPGSAVNLWLDDDYNEVPFQPPFCSVPVEANGKWVCKSAPMPKPGGHTLWAQTPGYNPAQVGFTVVP